MKQPIHGHMMRHVILRVVAKLVIPYILLFAIYVQFHGDFSPGGGFQAGVIFASAIILFVLIFGLESARRISSGRFVEACLALGLLLYAGVGFLCLFRGGAFLEFLEGKKLPAVGILEERSEQENA